MFVFGIYTSYIVGYIYLIKEQNSKFYKIGRSKNTAGRKGSLQTGNPRRLEIIMAIETDKQNKIEKMLHKRYKDFKVLNEWFEFDEHLVNDVIEITKVLADTYKNKKTITSDPSNHVHNSKHNTQYSDMVKTKLGKTIYYKCKKCSKEFKKKQIV